LFASPLVGYDIRMHTDASSLMFINYLSMVFDNVGHSVVLVTVEPDDRYKVLLTNKTFGSTSGFPKPETGTYIDEALEPAVYEQVASHYRRVVQTKEPVEYSEWMETPRGKRRFEVKMIPILNSVGECIQFAVISQDVTDAYVFNRERTAAIALNRYMAGNNSAFVVMDPGFHILRRLHLPPTMAHWESDHRVSDYLTKTAFDDFKRLMTVHHDTKQASFRPLPGAEPLRYTLFYDAELERLIMHIRLDGQAAQ